MAAENGGSAMSETSLAGGCLCGAVQLSITGEPVAMAYCHCESCRRWLGAPVHASSLWRAADVRFEKGADLLKTFKRTEGTGSRRQFCTLCGAPVCILHPGMEMIDIPSVSIPDLVFEPTLHTRYGEKVLGYQKSATYEALKVAKALGYLPECTDRFLHGTLSWSALKQISRVATTDSEKRWLEFAEKTNLTHLQAEVDDALKKNRKTPRRDGYGLPNLKTTFKIDLTLDEQ